MSDKPTIMNTEEIKENMKELRGTVMLEGGLPGLGIFSQNKKIKQQWLK